MQTNGCIFNRKTFLPGWKKKKSRGCFKRQALGRSRKNPEKKTAKTIIPSLSRRSTQKSPSWPWRPGIVWHQTQPPGPSNYLERNPGLKTKMVNPTTPTRTLCENWVFTQKATASKRNSRNPRNMKNQITAGSNPMNSNRPGLTAWRFTGTMSHNRVVLRKRVTGIYPKLPTSGTSNSPTTKSRTILLPNPILKNQVEEMLSSRCPLYLSQNTATSGWRTTSRR